jgi:predicted metal-dependent enzyme (double-stranded beta helix superfamily)
MPRKTRRSNKSRTDITNKIIDDGKPHYDQANIKKIPKLHRFINQISDIMDETNKESEILKKGTVCIKELVAVDDWLPPKYAEADDSDYLSYLLYEDPNERFSILSFVWGPGQSTVIHDHCTWGIVGCLRGKEISQHYAQTKNGHWVPDGRSEEIVAQTNNNVDILSPAVGDVHRVYNGLLDRPSISIHIYGGNLAKISRHVYHEDGASRTFISKYDKPHVSDCTKK